MFVFVAAQVKAVGFPALWVNLINPGFILGEDPERLALTQQIWQRALECLYEFVLGPRQPHLSPQHPWHVNNTLQNKLCVRLLRLDWWR